MHEPLEKPLISAMTDPGFYPHPVERVELRQTHISWVFLAGDFVYKVKKPVQLGFLDFSSLEKRRRYCREELELNRRLAPDIYLDRVAITRQDGRFSLEGRGRTVEYAVKMRRLPDRSALPRLLARESLSQTGIQDLGRMLADFYTRAEPAPRESDLGTWERVKQNCQENFRQTGPFQGQPLDTESFELVERATLAFLDRQKELFDRRAAQGRVRNCHGDLRAGHIYFDGRFHIIDCIEFNQRFRYHDLASDLAFLSMDLDFMGHSKLACQIMESCAAHLGDGELFLPLDFYQCYRAMVRCKVACFQMAEHAGDQAKQTRLGELANQYLALAQTYAIRFSRPTLWAICGLPGSGKSTLADRLGQGLGAPVLATDRIRKSLFEDAGRGGPEQGVGEGIYSAKARSLTYGRMLSLAHEHLKADRSVVLDGSFGDRHHRREVRRLARDSGAKLVFVECQADAELLRQRLKARESAPSLSDARVHHLADIQKAFEPLTELDPNTHIRAETPLAPRDCYHQVLARYHRLLSLA